MFRELLSATSALALIAGLGSNALACSPGGTITGPGAFAAFMNSGTLDCVTITNHAAVNGGVSNGSTGVIGSPASPQPGSLAIDSSTINGSVQNSGHIFASGGTPVGINVTGGSVITNGIINNSTGTIGVSNTTGHSIGINVSQSSFSGGITNNGVISVTSSAGSAVGISVGGSGGVGPAPINPTSVTTPKTTTSTTTGGVTGFSSKGRRHP
jgi:hypothetical protein